MPTLLKRTGPLIQPKTFRDTKDPCPVFDGKIWHIFGSGGTSITETWEVLHAIAPTKNGPWKEVKPALIPLKTRYAAPGVIYDPKENMFHMFLQTDHLAVGGGIYHFISSDGDRFNEFGLIIRAELGTDHACVYDPHPAIINNERYLSYSAGPDVGKPDIFVAKSAGGSWYGPWIKVGKILSHSQVEHHNQLDHPDYEWGLEGPQLIELPNKKVLLNAVCFLPFGLRGTRQRVFFAVSNSINGPYKSLGPMLETVDKGWGEGENGHAAGLIDKNSLHLFYQARSIDTPWRYGQAVFDISSL